MSKPWTARQRHEFLQRMRQKHIRRLSADGIDNEAVA